MRENLSTGILIVLSVGVLAVIGLFATVRTHGPVESEAPGVLTYNSAELGLSFEYPKNYVLQTFPIGNEERSWTALTLVDKDILELAQENGASEGPPAIAVQIFQNIEEYTLEEWITGLSYSNYKLSLDETLTPVTVGGQEALAYRYSGLFETDTVVVARGSRVYMFSVDWLTVSDQNRQDFVTILQTVTFN